MTAEPWTVRDTIRGLASPNLAPLPRPPYGLSSDSGVFLGVESMKEHMTDEGWQLALAFKSVGYQLAGYRLQVDETDVPTILAQTDPGIVIVQDKREWDSSQRSFRELKAHFTNVNQLRDNPLIFKATILKDAHQNPEYHRRSADEIGCHAWVVYYHPEIVRHVAPYVRPEDVVRTYHSLDPSVVPVFNRYRTRLAILSGAVSRAYPLRKRLVRDQRHMPSVTILPHPGYHRRGTATPDYMKILAHYKVAICTASRYGYLLRKIIEATAAGCVVITDLPVDEVVPEIDGNLIRVRPDTYAYVIEEIVKAACESYNAGKQLKYARKAIDYFNYANQGFRMVSALNEIRMRYATANVLG